VKNSKRLIWREKQSLATPPKGRGYKPRRNRGGVVSDFGVYLEGTPNDHQDGLGEAIGVRQWPLRYRQQDEVTYTPYQKNIICALCSSS